MFDNADNAFEPSVQLILICAAQHVTQSRYVDLPGRSAGDRVVGVQQQPNGRHLKRAEHVTRGTTQLVSCRGAVAQHCRRDVIASGISDVGHESLADAVDRLQCVFHLARVHARAADLEHVVGSSLVEQEPVVVETTEIAGRVSLHMFFHRLGPVLARRLLLTGDVIEAGEVEHLGVFTETCEPGAVAARARYWAEKAAKMPADGVVIAKEAFRLVEQNQAYQGEEVASYLFHAFGTNLQFAPGEFNFVKTRAEHGTKEAFRLRDEHFQVAEPEPQ